MRGVATHYLTVRRSSGEMELDVTQLFAQPTVPTRSASAADRLLADWKSLLSGVSIELLPEQALAFAPAQDAFPQGSFVFLPHIAGKPLGPRVDAAKHLIAKGFKPVVHLSARNFTSILEFEGHVRDLDQAGVKCCLAIGGVPSFTPNAVLQSTAEMIRHPAFKSAAFETVFIAGHPEGIAGVEEAQLRNALQDKISELREQRRSIEIVTQFAFDGAAMARWANDLRRIGVIEPIRFGLAGVTSLPKLVKFAVLCGVGASLSVLKRQAGSVLKVMRDQDPKDVIEALYRDLDPTVASSIHLHFFPFGGWEKTTTWISSRQSIAR